MPGLNAEDFGKWSFDFAQSHLRYSTYGLLRPLDLMQPYRLEAQAGQPARQ
jgi:cytoplasmic iron level regulating protein YaaA (DUF328/UPF0246 family)